MADYPGTVGRMRRLICLGLWFLLASTPGLTADAASSGREQADFANGLSISAQPESSLLTALENVQEQNLDQAQGVLRNLVRQTPDFRLAKLLYADILAAKAGSLQGLGAGEIPESELQDLTDEARRRWQHHVRRPHGNLVPRSLISLSPDIPAGVVVDLELSRMYVFANTENSLRFVDDYYISGGKKGPEKQREGDQRTPIGLYFTQKHLPGPTLPDYYGWGAFTLDYPNAWDRRQGKTGHGIWLHGNPVGTFSRPPQASDGCVTMHNQDLELLSPLLGKKGVPMVIARNAEWAAADELRQDRSRMQDLLERWRLDWESLDTTKYLGHYSRRFQSGDQDYTAWASHKKRVNARKSRIQVSLSNVNIFAYPHEPDIRVVTFNQEYWSDNYQSTSEKEQYWQREDDGQWRIIFEGSR